MHLSLMKDFGRGDIDEMAVEYVLYDENSRRARLAEKAIDKGGGHKGGGAEGVDGWIRVLEWLNKRRM